MVENIRRVIYTLNIILGQSAVGKDKILNELVNKYGYESCISYSTRPQRDGETQDKDYHFITDEQFKVKMLNNEFLETRLYHVTGNKIWYYGLAKESIDIHKNQLVILDAKGYRTVISALTSSYVRGLYITSSIRERLVRAISRESDREDEAYFSEIFRRFEDDLKVFKNIENDNNVFKINNGNGQFQNAILQILNIIEGREQFDMPLNPNNKVLSNEEATDYMLKWDTINPDGSISKKVNYENGDLVKVVKIINKKVKHLLHFVGQEGYIYFPIMKHGIKRYKVLFKNEMPELSAYFRYEEMELIKKRDDKIE